MLEIRNRIISLSKELLLKHMGAEVFLRKFSLSKVLSLDLQHHNGRRRPHHVHINLRTHLHLQLHLHRHLHHSALSISMHAYLNRHVHRHVRLRLHLRRHLSFQV